VKHLPRRPLIISSACLTLAVLAGCDITGEYERRFQETLANAGQRAAFDAVLFAAESEITGPANVGSGVKVRIPSLFDQAKPLATEPRAQPPFLQLPGFGYSLEKQLADASQKTAPAYVYYAAVPKTDQTPDQVQAPIAVAMKGAFPGAAWGDAQFKTPQGTTVTHKVIRGDGPQDFDVAGNGMMQKLDGRFALYFIDGPTFYALVGFRCPKAQADAQKFDAAVDAAMGTVSVPAGAAGPPAGAPAAGGAPAGGAPAGVPPGGAPAGGPAGAGT